MSAVKQAEMGPETTAIETAKDRETPIKKLFKAQAFQIFIVLLVALSGASMVLELDAERSEIPGNNVKAIKILKK